MSAPSLPELLAGHWHLSWSLALGAAFYVGIYLRAVSRVRGRWPPARTVSFLASIGCILVALGSGLDRYDDRLLSVHMVQHMLLLMLAPLLLLGGRPATLMLRATRGESRRRLARALNHLRPLTAAPQCLAAFTVVLLATHLPAFYDATLREPGLHEAEHLLYLLAGLLLWWPILDGDPVPGHRLSGLGRLVYLIVAMAPMAVVGAYLNRHASLVYAGYGPPAHRLGVSALTDQQQAGAIMWVGGSTIMMAVGLWAVIGALLADERRQQAREARVDAAEHDVPALQRGPAR